MSTAALVVHGPSALARRGGLHYLRHAIASPVSVASSVFGTCIGVSYGGLIGALAAMLAIVGACAMVVKLGIVQRHLDRQAAYLDAARRESMRVRMLRPAGPVRVQQYLDLRCLVEEIERTDPNEAQRFGLQDLLDHFVKIGAAHYRCLESLRYAHDAEMAATIPINRSKRRKEIHERRLRHRDGCLARVERLADELEATDELIRLCAQRVACPDIVEAELDREIERRLWELDEVDQALDQLSA